MIDSPEAGSAFSDAGLGAAHAMAHPMGGLPDLPHGQCNAVVLATVVDFNCRYFEPRYRDPVTAMGIDAGGLSSGEIRKRIVGEIRQRREAFGSRDTLSRLGVHRTNVRDLAENALKDP